MGNFFRCVRARANLHALMTQKSCAVGMRNAILRNHLNYDPRRVRRERGAASFPDVSLAAKGVGAQGMKGRGKDASLACSSPVSRASSSPASPASESKRLRRRQRGGYSRKNWVGVSGTLGKTLTLFMTKICDIPYPIYDLTKKFETLFMALTLHQNPASDLRYYY